MIQEYGVLVANRDISQEFSKLKGYVREISKTLPKEIKQLAKTMKAPKGRIGTFLKAHGVQMGLILATVLSITLPNSSCDDVSWGSETITQQTARFEQIMQEPHAGQVSRVKEFKRFSTESVDWFRKIMEEKTEKELYSINPWQFSSEEKRKLIVDWRYYKGVIEEINDYNKNLKKLLVDDYKKAKEFIKGISTKKLAQLIRKRYSYAYGMAQLAKSKEENNNSETQKVKEDEKLQLQLFIPAVEFALQERIMAMDEQERYAFLKSIDVPNYDKTHISGILAYVGELKSGKELFYSKLLKMTNCGSKDSWC